MTAYTFDQLIDFTRTSAGGYYGPDGLYRMTPASKNLLTYTQEFDNAAWVKTNATVVPNQNPAAASLGSELVTNGDFATDTVWTKGDGWTITGGLAVRSPAAFGSELTQPISLVAGRLYRVEYTISAYSAQSVRLQFNGGTTVLGTLRAANGTYVEYLTAVSGNNTLSFACGAAAASLSIDNVSVREVIGGWNVAPDGTSTADTLIATAGTASHNLNQSGGGSGSALTLSVFAKAGASNFVQLYHGSSSNMYANFNLSTGAVGTVGSSATAAITSVGNGWYRCSMTCTPGSASASRVAMITSATAAYNESWAATGTESVLIWGAQLELGSTATTYTRNVGGRYPPRFDYDPVTLAPRGLLVEEQRVNLLTYSEQFDAANWGKDQATISVNSVLSPDGTLDADTIVASATSNRHIVQRNGISPAVAAGSPATLSFYAKAAGYNFASASILWGAVSSGVGVVFDLINLTATSLGATAGATLNSASVVDAGNGWRRCIMTVTNASYALDYVAIGPCSTGSPAIENGSRTATFTGDGTSGIYLWGAQLEAGAFATSYIPTQASQVTRTTDTATITGANFSNWYNQTEGTFVVEADTIVPSATTVYSTFSVNDGTGTNLMRNFVYAGKWGVSGNVGSSQFDLLQSGSYTQNVARKNALGYKVNDIAFSSGGVPPLTDSVAAIPTVSQLSLGFSAGASQLNGHIQSIDYYPTRLTNAQIQALTA